ncbi:GNAT family N-acetyltransferase [Oleidesulfovibrio sp.]|uniref:GNAT family N-acetyltransferase n=1 Tax=Oleidesulfovibrio sp. TaxID=2909707 RepID=UPI003A837399
MATFTIITPRLILRQWRTEDYKPFAMLNADPEVMEFFPATLPRAASDAMADRCHQLIHERGWGFWAVEERQTGDFVGLTGLHTPGSELPFTPCIEVGWRLARYHWHKGYATEAAAAALHVAFNKLQLQEVVSFTAVLNVRSQAVMQRLSMEFAGPFEHPDLPPQHPLRPHVLYTISPAVWNKNKLAKRAGTFLFQQPTDDNKLK